MTGWAQRDAERKEEEAEENERRRDNPKAARKIARTELLAAIDEFDGAPRSANARVAYAIEELIEVILDEREIGK
jgi:hypothetical protein